MENNKMPSGWFAAFTLASVWFGTHVGGGFATGNQIISFFVQYGWTGMIYPLLSMGILAFAFYEITRFSRIRGLTSYQDTIAELWNPHPKMELSFEFFYIIVILSAVAAAVSGAASLLEEFLGLDYMVCCLITIALLVLLSIFGIKLIITLSTFLSAAILVVVAIMVTSGLATHMPQLAANAGGELVTPGFAFFRGVLVYAGFQCLSLPCYITAATTVSNNRGIKRAALLGGLMNGLALAASACMLTAWYPEILAAGKTTLPNLFVCESIGWQWLVTLYSVLLFCAFVSTSVTLVYSMIDRFSDKLPERVPSTGRRIIVGTIVIALCFSVSLLGLSTIISKIYSFGGYIGLFFVLLPILFIAPKKNKQYLAEHPDCLDD